MLSDGGGGSAEGEAICSRSYRRDGPTSIEYPWLDIIGDGEFDAGFVYGVDGVVDEGSDVVSFECGVVKLVF
jgi:hypothetical protein